MEGQTALGGVVLPDGEVTDALKSDLATALEASLGATSVFVTRVRVEPDIGRRGRRARRLADRFVAAPQHETLPCTRHDGCTIGGIAVECFYGVRSDGWQVQARRHV